MHVYGDSVQRPTNTLVFTFNTPVSPSVVIMGFIQAKVDVFVVINVKCLATTKTSVADKLYALTTVCLSIAHLASVKDLPSL